MLDTNIKTMKKYSILLLFFTIISIIIIMPFIAGCRITSEVKKSGGVVPTFERPPVPTSISNLLGAGAETFGRLSYTWFNTYQKLTQVKVSYQPIGTDVINQLPAGTIHFAVLDEIIEQQIQQTDGSKEATLSIPVACNVITIAYNLPDLPAGILKFSADVIAQIYLKEITRWNDTAILDLNPGLNLPDANIILISHYEKSGANFIFSGYLSRVSSDWKTRMGGASNIGLPVDIQGVGDSGVANIISQTPYSIGYIELSHAKELNLSCADIANMSGHYVSPSPDAASLATEGLPPNTISLLSDSNSAEAYPLSGLIWIVTYQDQEDGGTGKSLADMLWWAIHDGQTSCVSLDYAPLSSDAVIKAEKIIKSMKLSGIP
ncbi:MAG: phosphate ABC transporter substrate-binding protein PstS [Dehalococcoidales bacterium]|nr:phosphate ABC transporter substrate-binding protein PstS [Dehalococcoidales bacterium]